MTLPINPRQYQALLRQDFCAFSDRAFTQLNPTTEYLRNWHLEVLAAKFEACRRGTIQRLIVCLPPRSLKSLYASVALPAWWLGMIPRRRFSVCRMRRNSPISTHWIADRS